MFACGDKLFQSCSVFPRSFSVFPQEYDISVSEFDDGNGNVTCSQLIIDCRYGHVFSGCSVAHCHTHARPSQPAGGQLDLCSHYCIRSSALPWLHDSHAVVPTSAAYDRKSSCGCVLSGRPCVDHVLTVGFVVFYGCHARFVLGNPPTPHTAQLYFIFYILLVVRAYVYLRKRPFASHRMANMLEMLTWRQQLATFIVVVLSQVLLGWINHTDCATRMISWAAGLFPINVRMTDCRAHDMCIVGHSDEC